MKNFKFALFVVWLGFLTCQPLFVQAQDKVLYPINRYVRNEGAFDDFIVEFLIPCNTNYRIEASGNKEKKVFGRSSISVSTEGSRKRVTVTTGFRARKWANYHGNIDQWANALNLYYPGCGR